MTKTQNDSNRDLLCGIRRAKARRLLGQGVSASAMALVGVQGLAACTTDGDASDSAGDESPKAPNVPVPGAEEGKADWAQYDGERNTEMVQYAEEFWTEESQCNTRGGCMAIDVILKVFVAPQQGANLDTKRVGAVYRCPDWGPDENETALGEYFATREDGMEEWHVRVHFGIYGTWSSTNMPVFDVWYQDGLGHTYYDDNQGEFHVADPWRHAIRQFGWSDNPWYETPTKLTVDDHGVTGQIYIDVADIDYDKQLALVWTTDNWQTAHVYGDMGDSTNQWKWIEDQYGGMDLFEIAVDIPGSVDVFEYALVYKHGVVHDAKTYEFWDNNGGRNYVVTKRPPMDSSDYEN